MKKNVKKPWMLCCLIYSSFSCYNINGIELPVLPAVFISWLAGNIINSIDKNGGAWFTNKAIGVRKKGADEKNNNGFSGVTPITGKVLALDAKFLFNDAAKFILIKQGYALNDDALPTTTSFESGIKYLSIQELYIQLKRAWNLWAKLHPMTSTARDESILLKNLLPIITNNTTTNNVDSFTQEVPSIPQHTALVDYQKITDFFYNEMTDKIEWVLNVPTMTAVIAQSLASDPQGAAIEILYYFVSYYMTVFTQNLGTCFLTPYVEATGMKHLNKSPISTIIKASIGIIFSEYLMLFVTMPLLKEKLNALGIYDEQREDIHLLMYKAGIKTPFALAGIKKGYATIINPQFYTALQQYVPLIGSALIVAVATALGRAIGVNANIVR